MLISFVFLIVAPLSIFASPVYEVAQAHALEPRGNAVTWRNGKCTSTRSVTKIVTSTSVKTIYPCTKTTTINVSSTSTKTITIPQLTKVFSTTSTLFSTKTHGASTTVITSEFKTNFPLRISTISAPPQIIPIASPTLNQNIRDTEVANKKESRGDLEERRKPYNAAEVRCSTTQHITVTKATSTKVIKSTKTAAPRASTKYRTFTVKTTTTVIPSSTSRTETFFTTRTIHVTGAATLSRLSNVYLT
ncbi:hypothetical protein P154DRAFT_592387 [Amniculicola lignicola CBS 123094]|uniref:Uncharacterized protein n=1 Tax=Amniculicola lignicola CBS 123094 TaxID=1392246 RepID=A0A6A5X123_9PLEO|nr:hypothetical protein P154DRAFT_592387 [Amniculicola lignicola CBS 123094]